MTKKNLLPTIVLTAICLASALLLSVINMFTAPKIAERENKAALESLAEVLPGSANFEKLTLNENYPKDIVEAYSADGGFVFRANGAGRNGTITVMVGISTDGKIVGTKVISTEETPKYADLVYSAVEGTDGSYTGTTLESFSPVIIAGSSMTSEGFAGAIEAALKAYVVASGGTVDNRTPEEIIDEACNAALGTVGVKFTKWFRTESITGIDAVYESQDARVYVIGDSYIGVKDGMVVTENASDENRAAALLADSVIALSSPTEIEKPDGASRMITKIYKTSSGNYVFDLKASGFSAEYGGEEIIIKLSISKDGKIIDCLTVSQSESKGYGDKCASDGYYESWRGVSADGVVISPSPINPGTADPGAISGATMTSNAYQNAVKAAFKAFEILEGGTN